MHWLGRSNDKREDVKLVFENVKSIIVLATSYNLGIHHLPNIKEGKISRYAWGRDYHKVLDKKTRKLRLRLKDLGIDAKFYTDTGPCMDKQWAVEAGLGWQGKNGLVLNKKLGSYFFISVGFLDTAIEEDKPYQDFCGACTKCISACPTGAIIQDKVVDANKCISYWTIESTTDKFPKEISDNLNNWAFGCDICQEVCPWNNHKNKLSQEFNFLPKENETTFDYEKIKNMTEEEFNIRYLSTPMKRTKLSGIKRNMEEIRGKV
jgi:epoxyqueuosine reductase